ncbi:zinc finger BED domain-containing protein RICESLEEPER 1-like [Nicotiana tabacum]|uniref:Zinc finger BED domain-containing protein RICESLEEPER 1-like n=1 Tax=Nicotiana tabacum TaxID=4097 RepID=A0AC58SIQ7_TOBAC
MAKKIKLKFDKYWADFEDVNMLLFVDVVLDPRYKMKYVKFLFSKFYSPLEGNGKSTKVMDALSRLYNYYKDSISRTSNENIEDQTSVSRTDAIHSCGVWKSQWEKFLEDENNIDNTTELEKIARDVLAIPTSIVASESAFSTGGQILIVIEVLYQ